MTPISPIFPNPRGSRESAALRAVALANAAHARAPSAATNRALYLANASLVFGIIGDSRERPPAPWPDAAALENPATDWWPEWRG